MDMEDEARNKLLSLQPEQLQEVAELCNRYPSISLEAQISSAGREETILEVQLERDGFEEDETLPPVETACYPEV